MSIRVALYPPLEQKTVLSSTDTSLVGNICFCFIAPLQIRNIMGKKATNADEINNQIKFTAVVYPDEGISKVSDWAVSLWYNDGEENEEWKEAPFLQSQDEEATNIIHNFNQEDQPDVKIFVLKLQPKHPDSGRVLFTLKYKHTQTADWQWSGKAKGQDNGEVVYGQKHRDVGALDFSQVFQNTDQAITVREEGQKTKETKLWAIEGDATHGSAPTTLSLGSPTSILTYMALVKISDPWMGPIHGKQKWSNNRDGLLLQYKRSDGLHVVVLPLAAAGDLCTTSLLSDDSGNVELKTQNDGNRSGKMRCIVSIDVDLTRVVDVAMYAARKWIHGAEIADAEDIKPSWWERWMDGLAYCTWNGVGRDLTEQRVLDTVQDLEDQGIKITTLIIDDNWQDLYDRKWLGFEANKKGFPNGLKSTVSKIRERYPNVQHISVWHALLGYWGGIAPGGEIDQDYSCIDTRMLDGHVVRVVDAKDTDRLYNDFYKFLSDCGIDSTKCDVQYAISEMALAQDRGRLTAPYEDALKKYSRKYLQSRTIYCMSHVPAIFFGWLMPKDRPPVLCRNSDDFFPDIPHSHTWHVFANCYNAIFTSHLNCLPDFDMFQTTLPNYSSLHAAARCISGGPLYITDTPKQHNMQILNQMTALSPRGYSLNLRPSCIVLPTDPYVGYHDNKLLRVSNFTGFVKTGTPLMAVFNVSTLALSEIIPWSDFRGSHADVEYVVRAHTTGKIVGGDGKMRDENAPLSVALNTFAWEIFSAAPVQRVKCQSGTTLKVCTFGITTMMTGAAAVLRTSLVGEEEKSGKVKFEVTLKAIGMLGIWLSNLDKLIIQDLLVCVEDEVIPLECVTKTNLLEIDVGKAWNKYDPKRSNEITVTVYISV